MCYDEELMGACEAYECMRNWTLQMYEEDQQQRMKEDYEG